MKTIITIGIVGIAIIFSLGWYATSLVNDEKKAYEKHLGEKIILEKDTLTITDYSYFNENYILSNGQTVGFTLLDNLKVIK